jgi:hypothetical protein
MKTGHKRAAKAERHSNLTADRHSRAMTLNARSIPLFVFATIATIATVARAQEGLSQDYTLSEEVVGQLAPHLPSAPTASLPSLSFVQTIWNKGNFGKAVYVDGKQRITRLESGLSQVQGGGGFRHAAAAGEATSLSLCGFVPLLSVGQSS